MAPADRFCSLVSLRKGAYICDSIQPPSAPSYVPWVQASFTCWGNVLAPGWALSILSQHKMPPLSCPPLPRQSPELTVSQPIRQATTLLQRHCS